MFFTGIVIHESLVDPTLINRLTIKGGEVASDPNMPGDLWHLYTVSVTEAQVQTIANALKPTGFYAHFGNAKQGLVAFPGKVFRLEPRNSATWADAIDYGRSIGIPDAQLDFTFDDLIDE